MHNTTTSQLSTKYICSPLKEEAQFRFPSSLVQEAEPCFHLPVCVNCFKPVWMRDGNINRCHRPKGDTWRQTCGDSDSTCRWASRLRSLWAQLCVCIKRESSHCENANNWWKPPCVQQGQAPPPHHQKHSAVHFFDGKINWLSAADIHISLLWDNLWLVRWGCRGGFNISGAANSHQQFHIKHSEQARGLNRQRVSFISPPQPHLPAYLLLLLLPARSTTANFARRCFTALTLKPRGLNTWLHAFLLTSDFSIFNN